MGIEYDKSFNPRYTYKDHFRLTLRRILEEKNISSLPKGISLAMEEKYISTVKKRKKNVSMTICHFEIINDLLNQEF